MDVFPMRGADDLGSIRSLSQDKEEKRNVKFPFRHTESGNFKFNKKQLVHNSSRIAVLVADPSNTNITVRSRKRVLGPEGNAAGEIENAIHSSQFDDKTSSPTPIISRGSNQSVADDDSHLSPGRLRLSPRHRDDSESRLDRQNQALLESRLAAEKRLLNRSEPPISIRTRELNSGVETRRGARESSPNSGGSIMTDIGRGLSSSRRGSVSRDRTMRHHDSPDYGDIKRDASDDREMLKSTSNQMYHSPDEDRRAKGMPNMRDRLKSRRLWKSESVQLASWQDRKAGKGGKGEPVMLPCHSNRIEFDQIMEERLAGNEDLLELYEDAVEAGNEDWEERILQEMEQNFVTVTRSARFLDYDVRYVILLLTSEHIKIESEMDVFQAANRWIRHDMEQRKRDAPQVLGCVRFGLLTPEELIQACHRSRYLLNDVPCYRDLVLDALLWQVACVTGMERYFMDLEPRPRGQSKTSADSILEDGTGDKINLCKRLYGVDAVVPAVQVDRVSRLQIAKSETILVLGGLNPLDPWDLEDAGSRMFRFNPPENRWDCVGFLPEPCHYAASCVIGNKIYLTGGCKPALCDHGRSISPITSGWSFDFVSEKWALISDMLYPRIHHALVAIKGKLYAIGGMDTNNCPLATTEYYDPATNSWHETMRMHTARMGFGAAVIDRDIWVCGGLAQTSDQGKLYILDQVETYSADRNVWSLQAPLRMPRCLAACVGHSNRLYLVGGATRPPRQQSNPRRRTCSQLMTSITDVDVYDVRSRRWHCDADLGMPRQNAAAVIIGDTMLVMGGVTSESLKPLKSVEAYDVHTQDWDTSMAELPMPLSGFGVVVLPPV